MKDFDYNDFYNILPASKLPTNIRNFIGREKYLKKIKEAFTLNNKKIVVLSSMSGIGKSSIVTQYGYNFKSNGFVYWIDCNNVESEFSSFSSDLGIEEKLSIELIKAKLQNIVKNNLKENLNFLFIFEFCCAFIFHVRLALKRRFLYIRVV
jgi:ATP/maltotriose-dependent transcriptional regulator MalT